MDPVEAVLGADEPLMDAGLDSLGAVELCNALTKVMGTHSMIPSSPTLPITTATSVGERYAVTGFVHVPRILAASRVAATAKEVDILTNVLLSQVRQHGGVLGRLCTQLLNLQLCLRR
jgi:hypothetical protein